MGDRVELLRGACVRECVDGCMCVYVYVCVWVDGRMCRELVVVRVIHVYIGGYGVDNIFYWLKDNEPGWSYPEDNVFKKEEEAKEECERRNKSNKE